MQPRPPPPAYPPPPNAPFSASTIRALKFLRNALEPERATRTVNQFAEAVLFAAACEAGLPSQRGKRFGVQFSAASSHAKHCWILRLHDAAPLGAPYFRDIFSLIEEEQASTLVPLSGVAVPARHLRVRSADFGNRVQPDGAEDGSRALCASRALPSPLFAARARSCESLQRSIDLKSEFLQESWTFSHPNASPPRVDPVVEETLKRLASMSPSEVESFRKRQRRWITDLASALQTERDSIARKTDRHTRPLIGALHGPLLKALLTHYGYDDPTAADLLSHGAEVAGWLDGRPEWPVHHKAEAPRELERVIADSVSEREAFTASIRPSPHDQILWDASCKDRNEGRMLGPFSSCDAVAEVLGTQRFVINRRFGVIQPEKVRPCDDARSSGANRATGQRRKVTLSSIDKIAAQCRLAAELFPNQRVMLWKRDHQSAYRQVPLTPGARRLAVVAFCHPDTGAVTYWVHLCLPFGLTAAVVAYNRVAQAVTWLANKALLIPADSFFDDFWSLCPESDADSSFEYFGFLNEILGLVLKVEKDLRPTVEGEVLGHGIKVGTPPFLFFPTESRIRKITFSIFEALARDSLRPQEASSLAGKLQFTTTALYGKVGRAACKPLYARAHSYHRQFHLSSALRAALLWLLRSLFWAPRRSIRLTDQSRPQVRALVDASSSKGHGGWLGVILSLPEDTWCTSWEMPSAVLDILKPRGNYIQFLEMASAILLFATFPDSLSESDLVMYCDNTAQEGALAKGFSTAWDMAVVAGVFWELAGRIDCDVWIERVPSELNLADCPSRPFDPNSRSVLEKLNVQWTPPGDMTPLLEILENLSEEQALRYPDLPESGTPTPSAEPASKKRRVR